MSTEQYDSIMRKLNSIGNRKCTDKKQLNALLKSVLLIAGLSDCRRGLFSNQKVLDLVLKQTSLKSKEAVHNFVNKICMRVTRGSNTFTDYDYAISKQLFDMFS